MSFANTNSDAVLRSSLYSHFSESLSGIGTIRAYAVSTRFIADNARRMDVENRAYFLTIVNQRWLGVVRSKSHSGITDCRSDWTLWDPA